MAGNYLGFWYPVTGADAAADIARNGTWACVIAAFMVGLPTVAGTLNPQAYGTPRPLGYLAIALFLALAVLIWRLSLTAAIAAIALYAITLVLGLYRGVGTFGVVILLLAALYFVHGVRGTLAWRRLRESAAAPLAQHEPRDAS